MSAGAVISVERTAQVLRRLRGGARNRPRGRAGEIFAFLGRTAQARRPPSRSSRATASGRAGEVRVLGDDPARPTAPGASAIGDRAAGVPADAGADGPRGGGAVRGLLPVAARRGRDRRASSAWSEKADARAAKLSGGQQRRLDVALALVGDPELLFLDEPTTGFDPSARRQAWEVIGEPARPRQDDLPDHPLHGRGAGPGRPGGDPRRRGRSSPQGPPGRARRTAPSAPPGSASGSPGGAPASCRRGPGAARVDGRGLVDAQDPVPVTAARADRLGDRRAASTWRASRSRQPSLEDVYLELTGRERHGGGPG